MRKAMAVAMAGASLFLLAPEFVPESYRPVALEGAEAPPPEPPTIIEQIDEFVKANRMWLAPVTLAALAGGLFLLVRRRSN